MAVRQSPPGVGRARASQVRGMLELLRHVHEHPDTTRAGVARELGLSRGLASEITGRLRVLDLVEEGDAERTGERGRPTRVLGPHPAGPVVAALDVSHEAWRLAIGALGGGLAVLRQERHDGNATQVLTEARRALDDARRDLGSRLRAVCVALPGTVSAGRLLQASHLGWQDLDVVAALDPGLPVLVGNDAALGGVAEARRGAGRGTSLALHLAVEEVGIGGVLLDQGRPIGGSTGTGGEFGHLPFGDPARLCPCGARGCWDLDFDGRAMLSRLDTVIDDPRTATSAVLRLAAAGDPIARGLIDEVAASLGRGAAGLVNALDPEVVTLSGTAAALLAAARPRIEDAYTRGLMLFRRADPPALIVASFPDDGALRGAAELAFDLVLSEAGIDAWQSAAAAR